MQTLFLMLMLTTVNNPVIVKIKSTNKFETLQGKGVVIAENKVLTAYHIVKDKLDIRINSRKSNIYKTYPKRDLVILSCNTRGWHITDHNFLNYKDKIKYKNSYYKGHYKLCKHENYYMNLYKFKTTSYPGDCGTPILQHDKIVGIIVAKNDYGFTFASPITFKLEVQNIAKNQEDTTGN